MRHRRLFSGLLGILAAALAPRAVVAEPQQFESEHIHPIDLVGDRVLVVNTPDARLSVFSRSSAGLFLEKEVRVGIDPVTVRAQDSRRAWVVNHLSDDISIVDLDLGAVIHTLRVGDEPADVAFVLDPIQDDNSLWAVVSLSQEDRVLVLDAEPPFTRFALIDLPAAEPRALAATADRRGVWVAAFESANRSTLVDRFMVGNPAGPWGGGLPPFVPPLNPNLPPELLPTNGTIAQKIAGTWVDEQGGDWSSLITWDVMDNDLFRIDVTSATPSVAQVVPGVGTLLTDLAVDPATQDVWVLNEDAMNRILFEPKLKGEAVRTRVSRVSVSAGTAQVFSLNPHITFGPPGQPNPPSPAALRRQSVALPTEILFSGGGHNREIFVSAMGGSRILVLDPATGNVKRRLGVPEGGTGLAYVRDPLPDPAGMMPSASMNDAPLTPSAVAEPIAIPLPTGSLLLVDRFQNRLHVVDVGSGATGQSLAIGKSAWDPTPSSVKKGRRFLYTGAQSAHGTMACASCHPGGHMDGIAWDLGNPAGEMDTLLHDQEPFVFPYHPLKGPMVTQTLRGLLNHDPFHWRGDRMDFIRFNPAFATLLGGETLATPDMLDFEDFMLAVTYPPNPFRDLNDAPGAIPGGGDPAQGAPIFTNLCLPCHLTPTGAGPIIFEGQAFGKQFFKIAQLRGLFEKEGMDDPAGTLNKRGFGFLHDGMEKNLDQFLTIFNLNATQRQNARAFLMSFPTETDPAIGAQAIVMGTDVVSDPVEAARIDELQKAAAAGRVDVIVTGSIDGEDRGFLWIGTAAGGLYQSDRMDRVWSLSDLLRAASLEGPLVWTGVPDGEGVRMGVDRDGDGFLDGDEIMAGSDPADPESMPILTGIGDRPELRPELTRVASIVPSPFASRTRIEVYVAQAGRASVEVYDVNGRRVRRLLDESMAPGSRVVEWDGVDDAGRAVAGGTYFVKLVTAGGKDSRKIVRLP